MRHYLLVTRLKYVSLLLLLAVAITLSAEEVAPKVATGGNQHALPTISELVKRVLSGQQEVESIRKNYIFTMEEEEQEPDGHGGLKVKHHKTYEVHYSGPWVVKVLTAKDGRQLSAEEKGEEDKQMQRARLSLDRMQSDPEAEGAGGLKPSDFLMADQFINLRREQYHGREALVLDFVPNPSFRPKRPSEKILKNLSGRIWIDEQDMHLIRLEARLTDNVSFGGFLASVKKGAAVVREQQKVNDEIWLPSYSEMHFDARALFSGKRINLVQRFSNYRKFQVKTEIKPF